MAVLLIDNFDSFTYNLQHLVLLEGVDCSVWRNNDQRLLGDLSNFSAIILSPGPGIPALSGHLMEVISSWHAKMPMLGICLGHQALGVYFGAKLVAAPRPMHGMISPIQTCADENTSPWMGIQGTRIEVMRYHSWVLVDLPEALVPLAYSVDDGCLMAMRHRHWPLYGVQFHPESVIGIDVRHLIASFLHQTTVLL